MNEVKVLALDGCNHCKTLISLLEAKNVPFELADENKESSNSSKNNTSVTIFNDYGYGYDSNEFITHPDVKGEG